MFRNFKSNRYGEFKALRLGENIQNNLAFLVKFKNVKKSFVVKFEKSKTQQTYDALIIYDGELVGLTTKKDNKLFKFSDYDIHCANNKVKEFKDTTREENDIIFKFSTDELLVNYFYLSLQKFEIKA